MAKKKIGILFGMEDTFPWALISAINSLGGDEIESAPVSISYLTETAGYEYELILDRISHEVPFYRTFLKCAVARGAQVINNPFWWVARANLVFGLHVHVAVEDNEARIQLMNGLRYFLPHDFGKIVEVPTEALLDELLEFIDSVLDELGSRKEAQYISEILRNRTGADRQLQVYERTGSLPAVVDYIMQETECGIPL